MRLHSFPTRRSSDLELATVRDESARITLSADQEAAITHVLRSTDRVFGALPIYHVYGLASVLLGTFCAGASLATLPRFEARRALDLLAGGRLTIFQAVPAMYARMLEADPGARRAESPELRYLYAGGSPLDILEIGRAHV